jgi:hypothetical protein
MSSKSRTILFGILTLLASCGGGGSGGGSSGGSGTLTINATDAPLDHSMVSEADIWIRKITIHTDPDADSGFLTVYDGAPIEMNLLHLNNGVVQTLAQHDLPAGSYRQLRLYVDHARLVLVNGNVYTTEAGNLTMPSAAQSGFKVFIDPPVQVVDAVSTTLLLDFDLSKTFHPIPNNDPLNATTYSLQPVIHAANVSTTGEFRGVVTTSNGQGGFIPVELATVYLLPPGETDVDNSIASTSTTSSGQYAILGVTPGTYDLLATKGALDGRVNAQSVLAGSATTVDIVID